MKNVSFRFVWLCCWIARHCGFCLRCCFACISHEPAVAAFHLVYCEFYCFTVVYGKCHTTSRVNICSRPCPPQFPLHFAQHQGFVWANFHRHKHRLGYRGMLKYAQVDKVKCLLAHFNQFYADNRPNYKKAKTMFILSNIRNFHTDYFI